MTKPLNALDGVIGTQGAPKGGGVYRNGHHSPPFAIPISTGYTNALGALQSYRQTNRQQMRSQAELALLIKSCHNNLA